MKLIQCLALWLVCSATTLLPADTKTIRVPAGLIELRIEAPAGADVSWEGRQPYDLVFKTYELNNVCVFCYHQPARLVVVSDIIDWDARQRTKTTWIVNVGEGDNPQPPDPPNPPNPPTPPTPDVPDTVTNKYGLGKLCYIEAVKLNKKSEATSLGATFFSVARDLHQGRITTDVASTRVIDAREKLSDSWDKWEVAVQPQFSKTVSEHGSGPLHYRNYFLEVSRALEAAGK